MSIKIHSMINGNEIVTCRLKNTGNGYIARFPAVTSVEQDYYVCLNYSQAEDLYKALKKEFKE